MKGFYAGSLAPTVRVDGGSHMKSTTIGSRHLFPGALRVWRHWWQLQAVRSGLDNCRSPGFKKKGFSSKRLEESQSKSQVLRVRCIQKLISKVAPLREPAGGFERLKPRSLRIVLTSEPLVFGTDLFSELGFPLAGISHSELQIPKAL